MSFPASSGSHASGVRVWNPEIAGGLKSLLYLFIFFDFTPAALRWLLQNGQQVVLGKASSFSNGQPRFSESGIVQWDSTAS